MPSSNSTNLNNLQLNKKHNLHYYIKILSNLYFFNIYKIEISNKKLVGMSESNWYLLPPKMFCLVMVTVSIIFCWFLYITGILKKCLGNSPTYLKCIDRSHLTNLLLTNCTSPKSLTNSSVPNMTLPIIPIHINPVTPNFASTTDTHHQQDISTSPPIVLPNLPTHSYQPSLKCLYTNATSLNRSKLNELVSLSTVEAPDLIFIAETWFKPTSFTSLPNFNLSRLDRITHGGGIAIYTNSRFKTNSVDCLKSCQSEQLWIELVLPSESILIGCIYRPPASPTQSVVSHAQANLEILKNIKKAKKLIDNKKFSGLLIVGDLNFPSIIWGPENSYQLLSAHTSPAGIFLSTLQDECLTQHVDFPTFIQANNTSKNTLDYVITESPARVSNLIGLPPLGSADQGHLILSWNLQLISSPNHRKVSSIKYNYKKGDYVEINKFISNIDWVNKFNNQDINHCYQLFLNIYTNACDKFIPKIKINANPKYKSPWMTNDLLLLIKSKKHLFFKNVASKWKVPELVAEFKTCRSLVKSSIKKRVAEFELELVKDKTNPKRLFAYTKSHQKISSSIESLSLHNRTTTNRIEIADALNQQFQSVFVDDSQDSYLPRFAFRTLDTLNSVDFNVAKVEKHLHLLQKNKSKGTDAIHPYVLKESAKSFALPISLIFKLSFNTSTTPSSWSEANVSPIHKKGSKTAPANYRPISLTSVPCKIMEKIVNDTIKKFLFNKKLITNRQHGFVNNKSCTTNLLETSDILTKNFANKKPTDMVLLDFAKAFDKVPHKRLLHKLSRYGIHSRLLYWIEAFLSNRKQRVILGADCSDWIPVTSGVPQGSVIGPTLFVIYINDLPDDLHNIALLFADDTKILATIDPNSYLADVNKLQNDLDIVTKWCKTWLMELNISKCKIIHVGKNNLQHNYHLTDFHSNTQIILDKTTSERDLGIIVTSNLKSSSQANKAASKANSMIGLMKRTFISRDLHIWTRIYKTYIRPHLEFSISAWNPSLQKDITILEQVQRRVTKIPHNTRHLNYEDRCKKFHITSLSDRRLRGDLIQQYKITNEIDKINWYSPPTILPPRGGHRGYHTREVVRNCGERHNFFTNRIVSAWNSLPDSVVQAESVNSFKNRLDEHSRH